MCDDELRRTLNVPDHYLSLVDTKNGRYIIVMDRVDGALQYGDVITAAIEGKDVKELGGPDFEVETLIKGSADAAAALHARYWNDKAFQKRYEKILVHGEWT